MFTFTEVPGFSREEYTSGGFATFRSFVVDWTKRGQFWAELFRLSPRREGPPALVPPEDPQARVAAVCLRPLDAAPRGQSPDDSSAAWGALVRAEVQYRLPVEGAFGPSGRSPSVQRIGWEIGSELSALALSPQGWSSGASGTGPLPADQPLALVLPLCHHRLVLRLPFEPPWELLRPLRGKVNARPFLGFPPESLLALWLEGRRLPRLAPASPPGWELVVVLAERCSLQDGQPIGWNHLFCAQTGRWERLQAAGHTLYPQADFDILVDLAWA